MKIKKSDLLEIVERLEARPVTDWEPGGRRGLYAIAYSRGAYGINWIIWQDRTTGLFYHGPAHTGETNN